MSEPDRPNEPSTDVLVQRYVSGEITPEEGNVLWDRLQSVPELRARLFQQLETDAMLQEVVGEESPRDMETEPVFPAPRGANRSTTSFRPFAFSVGTACLLLLLFGLFHAWSLLSVQDRQKESAVQTNVPGRTSPEETPEATTTAVAIVSASADAAWDERNGIFRLGESVEPGWLRLRSGLVSLEFFNGAEVVLAGPAELEIVSVDNIRCRFGNINVTVPPQAQGFVVTSPQMSVKDLGTAFAVSVTHRGTEVHVIKGEIELQDTPFGQENLKEGEAMFVASQGTFRRFDANSDVFAPTRSLKDKTKEYQILQYEKWKSRRDRFDADPALVFRFDFENLVSGTESVPNAMTSAGSPIRDGRIVGCRPAQGRWPGKGAVEFSRTSDRIRLRVPESYESMTFSAWLRINSLNRRTNSLLMTQSEQDKASPSSRLEWSIPESGVLRLELGSPVPGEVLRYDSPPYFLPEHFGQWTHVAVVVDGLTQTVSHFVNGMMIGSPHVETPFKEALPIFVGTAEIGNAPTVPSAKRSPIRNFCGCIDEFHFFARALSREEIWDLYDPVPDWMTDEPAGAVIY